jgi:succinate dehydrogenase/fumarate reductase flavoprotein subunit
VSDYQPLDSTALAEERNRIFAPLARKSGMNYGELETIVRIIATDHLVMKTEMSLTAGIAKLNRLDMYRDELKANNFHELMRCHEAVNIQSVAKILAHAALARKESRFGPYHQRADFPETRDEFCGLIVVRKNGNGVATRFEPLSYN